ncbi:MAG: glycosyltransferase family 2 protein [Candidatus Marinimicrobia bacterium]|nr:glycosyltransferase family 2 protein [Candidatus Neomarinimicrobiota bacterium]
MKISIIIPIYNEQDSIKPLINSISILMDNEKEKKWEILFVDDGSKDKTLEILQNEIVKLANAKIIQLQRNYGQTAAISAGIDNSKGNILVTMDADLQNDPSDIPKLIKKLDYGYDVVSGWREKRKDRYFTRILPSKIANWIISKISGVTLHDYGCTLKAYKKTTLKNVKLYGEMHRFIPIYITWQGGKVTEIPIRHHARKFGKSKYGLMRTFSVIADLIFLKYMEKHFTHPIHLFGGISLLNFGLSIISFLLMSYFKFWGSKSFIQTPLPQLVILFAMIGILSMFMGFLAEILMRTYYESQDKKSYQVRETTENIAS